MFDQLFKQPCALSRQRSAPLASERASFLAQRAEEGTAPGTLVRLARELLVIVQELDLTNNDVMTPLTIEAAAERWARHQERLHRAHTRRWSQVFFRQTATDWLRFLGRLYVPEPEPKPFAALVEHFANGLQHERGFSTATISNYQWHIERFLSWFSTQPRRFADVCVADTDSFLARQGTHWCRVSIAASAKALRAFFRHAEVQQWCRAGIAAAIESPRLFRDETLPAGPAWEDVRHIIPPGDTQQPRAIRDRAILLLFAVYGLRSGEVARLRLEDIDWALEQLTVTRTKQHRSQIYPLTHEVGSAIVRYLQEVRPRCGHRAVFLTLQAPFRPLSGGGLYHLTRSRFDHLGVRTPHRGPHALRHACACHLLAEGFSLEAISDHLGHQSLGSTRRYARVDLTGLREVARFDLGGLL
ncbi:MAG: integrase [Deltaproteobacteria bacterium]|nr:integrase [Deltaproteobacteria bacterium]